MKFILLFLSMLVASAVLRASEVSDSWRQRMWKEPVVIREGVTLRAYALEKPRMMKAYLVKVDLSTPGIGFTATERDPKYGQKMTDYTNEVRYICTKREMTLDFMTRKRNEGTNVEIAINTSGWRPWGGKAAIESTYAEFYRWDYAEGKELSFRKNPGVGTYFIICKDGGAFIRSRINRRAAGDWAFAIYGNRHLLQNGAVTPAAAQRNVKAEPRTALGLTPDGRTLVVLAVDGRQRGYSEGATCAELAEMLLKEGCADAVNMDGGGSTSLVIYDKETKRPVMLNHHGRGYKRRVALNLGITFSDDKEKQ